MKKLICLWIVSSAALAAVAKEVEAPYGNYEFRGNIGMISSTETVRIKCVDAGDYIIDQHFKCEFGAHICDKPDDDLNCSRYDHESDFYKLNLPRQQLIFKDSKLTLEKPAAPLQLVEDKSGRKIWSVPAAYRYTTNSYVVSKPSYFYFQAIGFSDRVSAYRSMTEVFNVSGPQQIWFEETWQGETKDAKGYIVTNRVSFGMAYEKAD